MLQSLRVKNLALIDEAELEFATGLNILTGETGAGKSILLGSINLALGGKYTKDLLRKGTEFGYVELVFQVVTKEQEQVLRKHDIFQENGCIILSRKLMEGRSVSKINGETVTKTVLKDVASNFISIHGQHEHQTLLNNRNHLSILDDYLLEKDKVLVENVKNLYREFLEKQNEYKSCNLDVEARNRELAFCQFELEEIESANLQKNEDKELEEQYKKLSNGKTILERTQSAYENTSGSFESASAKISSALQSLQGITQYDHEGDELYSQLVEIDNLLNDFNRDLSNYSSAMEFSSEAFVEIEERLNIWNRLKGKYGNSYEEIKKYSLQLVEKIEKMENYDIYLSSLEKELKEKEDELLNHSKQLSQCRKKYAKQLEMKIIEGLKELNFLEVQFEIGFTRLEKPQTQGLDEVQFLVSLNPGEEVKPLSQVVSGGELSRIMLTMKTVMADKSDIDTMIFDEVDAGISGVTATKVGEKLAQIGKLRQVICITHLAQIAALSDSHFCIEKKVIDKDTITSIHPLSETETIEELSRILGGGKVSEAITRSAIEMREMAKSYK